MYEPTATTADSMRLPKNDAAAKPSAHASTPTIALKACAIGYWGVFWLMNGLDKFLNRTDIGLFNWFGKDRTNQFTEYFNRLGIDLGAIDPVLIFIGLWEVAIAVPLFLATVLLFRGQTDAKFEKLLGWGYVFTAGTLIFFSAFDVVAGDRAELREHGLYLALLFGCAIFTGIIKTDRAAR